ncbi:MAG: excinuclease ABC subunit B, partial [Rhizobiaceae bacterium]
DAARDAEAAAKAARPNMFKKPDLDEMGTSGDHAMPAGAVPRSLFKKQNAREAHGSDYGTPERATLFRKNSLDEMTVRRTEKPVQGVKPSRLPDDPKPVLRKRAGIGSYEDPVDQKRAGRSRKTGRPGK